MLEKQISADYIQAMKAKDKERVGVLSFLRAQIKNVLIDKRMDSLDDVEVIAIIKKQVKQRLDSIDQYRKGGREDLASQEEKEFDILKTYLPQEMSAEELEPLVVQAIAQAGATGMKDMGAVMKALMPLVAGKADNKLVSEVVRKKLGGL
ncbi:MAG TPA: GatB/YqeY domain-containing protein [Candidatus Bathyarchaeia archaeon]|nr:GatB/YqeY domain-containing protein [Candidatus Bathyarchaeia archaeon]